LGGEGGQQVQRGRDSGPLGAKAILTQIKASRTNLNSLEVVQDPKGTVNGNVRENKLPRESIGGPTGAADPGIKVGGIGVTGNLRGVSEENKPSVSSKNRRLIVNNKKTRFRAKFDPEGRKGGTGFWTG